MNIVFFGSSQFAVPSLKALVEHKYAISCVVTQPDKEKGRGLHLASTPVKSASVKLSLKIYQPENVNHKESIKFLRALNPDLFVIVSYGQILSADILGLPGIFSVNVHASLLPKYRGAAPVSWALIKGEKETGVTLMQVGEKMDTGPIILQERIKIGAEDNAETLEERLSVEGATLLLRALRTIESKKYSLIPQDDKEASYAPKLRKNDGMILWNSRSADILNLVRGCVNWPGAFTYYNGKLLKVFKARISTPSLNPASLSPGEIESLSAEGITVATGDGRISLEEVQIEGRRRMSAKEFIAGYRMSKGDKFSKK